MYSVILFLINVAINTTTTTTTTNNNNNNNNSGHFYSAKSHQQG